jgi:hypothetical protein
LHEICDRITVADEEENEAAKLKKQKTWEGWNIVYEPNCIYNKFNYLHCLNSNCKHYCICLIHLCFSSAVHCTAFDQVIIKAARFLNKKPESVMQDVLRVLEKNSCFPNRW